MMTLTIAAMTLATLAPGDCRTLADFSLAGEVERWQVVNDGVMGGLSRGRIAPADANAMRFWGNINTNGGGFSSIRHRLASGAMEGATHVRVTMKGDGRAYQLSLRSNASMFGRSVAYRGTLRPQGKSDWKVATIALSDLEPSIFGRRVPAGPFDPAAARSIGFILADGQDGPFEMQVRRIEVCSN